VGSKTFDGVWFVAYADDHLQRHVHGRYAATEVLIDLFPGAVQPANRVDAIRPLNAKRPDVREILNVAA
jgi:hypothetical protein